MPEMGLADERRSTVYAMTEADVGMARALSKAEKWPHRSEDLAAMLAVGHGTISEMGGQAVAMTMWCPRGDRAATPGMLIVARTHRGAGLSCIVTTLHFGRRAITRRSTEAPLRRADLPRLALVILTGA